MLGKALAAAAKATQPAYVEDVFQTWLYTGNGSTQTITNGIDLAGKGGLVWIKNRSQTYDNQIFDTARGATKELISNSASGETTDTDTLTAFNTSGFDLGADVNTNGNSDAFVSWTFRKQAKFFDVVTFNYTSGSIRVPHSLGSVPGCIIVKYVGGNSDWYVYHRSRGRNYYSRLNQTSAEINVSDVWDTADPTSTDFGMSDYLLTAGTWVAYVFAHDAGGFGASGNDSVISCGSFAGGGTVTLGWEPQYILWKAYDAVGAWRINDNMRGLPTGGTQSALLANASDAETTNTFFDINPTGFKHLGSGANYIYIAIRRGPMKTPTDATKVFDVDLQTGGGFVTTNFPVDLTINARPSATTNKYASARLTSGTEILVPNLTDAAVTGTYVYFGFDKNNGIEDDNWGSGSTSVYWNFRRAPGFFDVVAYTGLGVARTVSHNLGVVPELMIVKRRDAVEFWPVYSSALGNTKYLTLNGTAASATGTDFWNSTTPTSTQFTVGLDLTASNYITYLFATLTGVSKVGSYTGTGTTLSIDCGFTNGARFVLIKRTDSTGDWYVWDTARGIVSADDPYLLLNSTAAEVTNTDYIDPLSSGFQISSTAPAAINANGGSFIYLAIA